MKRFQPLILLLLIAAIGCRSSEPLDNIVRADNSHAFNVVSMTGARSGIEVFDDASYYAVFDDDNLTAEITVRNLRVRESDTPLTLTFSDVPMRFSRNSHEIERVVEVDNLVSTDPVSRGTTITDVTIVYTESNDLNPNGTGGIYARFVVDGQYVVTAYPYNIFADGTTRIDNVSSGHQYIDYKPTYELHLDPKNMTATLNVENLKLDNESYSFSISRLALRLTDDGYTLTLQPGTTCDGVPSVKSFTATADLRTELKIDMTLVAGGKSYDVASFLTPDLSKQSL